jgi:hypothetical protein
MLDLWTKINCIAGHLIAIVASDRRDWWWLGDGGRGAVGKPLPDGAAAGFEHGAAAVAATGQQRRRL